VPAKKYTVRIDGASLVAYAPFVIAGIRDPLILKQLDSFFRSLRATVGAGSDKLSPPRGLTCSFSSVLGANGRSELGTEAKIYGH